MKAMKNIGWIIGVMAVLLVGCGKEARKNPLLSNEGIQFIRNSIDVYTIFNDKAFEKECQPYLIGKQPLSAQAKTRCDKGVEKMFEGFAQNSTGELPTQADKFDPNVWKRVFGIEE